MTPPTSSGSNRPPEPCDADLEMLRALPGRLRENRFRGTAVVAEGRLIDFEPGNTESESFAVAVDVGTTTLAAMLLDLATGTERAVAARLNPQTSFGDDVLSRIHHARENPEGLGELHEAIIGAIDEMIGELVEAAGIRRERIYEIAVAGNTTMQQLFCRIDTHSLGEVPFVAATARRISAAAGELGLHLHPRAKVYVMPVIGGFVGGDTVAGILATRLAENRGPSMLVDIGTNGEIVLFAHGKLTAASTAAGPAFEGARISQGMRGSTGAIEKVVVDDALRTNVIGNVRADRAVRLGADRPGRRIAPPRRPRLRRPAARRGRTARRSVCPTCAAGSSSTRTSRRSCWRRSGESGSNRRILVTQRDFRELQLATGAIRAGELILLKRAGLRPTDLERVLIAGGFGNFIRRSNAQRIGLLPHEIPRSRIRYQGNTALAGARLAALSQTARRHAEKLAVQTEHVDLSHDIEFQNAFADAMIFPEDGG